MSVRDQVATSKKKYSRTAVLQIICGVCVLALGGCSRNNPAELLVTYTGDHKVAGDAATTIKVSLEPGSYLVEAREQDIDLHFAIIGAGDRVEEEDTVPRHGLHAAVVSVTRPTDVSVELRSTDHRTKRGSAKVTVARWQRTAADAPGEREQGYRAFGLAGAQTGLKTKDSWAKAAALLNEAAAHFEAAGDDAGHAQAQYTLGHLQYLERDDRLAAVRAAEAATDSYEKLGDEAGVQNAATLRAAAELEIASGMSAGTQRAEQRSLYEA